MIYDAVAANQPSTQRLERTAQFLQTGKSEAIRNAWIRDEQGTEQAQRRKDWSDLAIPSPGDLQGKVLSIPSAWAIQFTFTLATPYLSKGIEAFDLLDNPIIRDKVYEVPIVPASSWKGGLRAAAMMHLFDGKINDYEAVIKAANKLSIGQQHEWDARLRQLVRIFGVDRGIEHDHSAGRLHCFPTGFKTTACQVINPHDRARRVSRNPILLECVPSNEDGTFTALYVPFGDVQDGESVADLALCVAAIRALLMEWGIGAKKSDGNGLAKEEIEKLYLGPQKQVDSPEPQRPSLPDVCQQYEERFGIDYRTVKPNDWKPHDGANRAAYLAAREAHQWYKHQQEAYPRLHEAWEKRPKISLSIIGQVKLTNLVETVQTQLIPTLMEEKH